MTPGASFPDGDPYRMQVAAAGGSMYARALLTVPLVGGHDMLFCVWVRVDDGLAVGSAFINDDAYARLTFTGRLSNALPTFGCRGAKVTAAVHDPGATTAHRVQRGPRAVPDPHRTAAARVDRAHTHAQRRQQ